MRRRLYLILFTVIVLTLSLTSAARAEPPSPPGRHSISVGEPGSEKVSRERARRSGEAHRAGSVSTLAASVDPVGTQAADALDLAGAIVSDSSLLRASYVTTPPTSGTNGVATDLGGVAGRAGLLTNGDATLAPQPNDFLSSGRDSGGGRVRGDTAYDVTTLELTLQAPAWASCLKLEMKYFSEEFPDYVRSAYNDGFVAELDKTTWTTRASSIIAPDNFAYDPSGHVISTNTSGLLTMSAAQATGTTYNGATPKMEAGTPITPGTHQIYLSIFDQYDAVYDSAILLHHLRFTTDSGTDCGTGAHPVTRPLILIPGILGSKLNDSTGSELWPNAAKLLTSRSDSHLDATMLNRDGESDANGNGVHATDIIRSIAGSAVYSGAISAIENAGYVLGDIDAPRPGDTYFISPADWRKSAKWNAQVLLDRIAQVLDATEADRVNIVAHSQGGLIVAAAVRDSDSVGRINRIATIATPYLGAAKALGVLHYRTPCVIKMIVESRCLINPGEAAKITENFPGFLELLPSDNYHRLVEPPLNRLWDGTGPLTPEQVRGTLQDHNLPLIDAARAWHQSVDTWKPADPKIGLTRLVGTGVVTPVSLDEFRRQECDEKYGWWVRCTGTRTYGQVNWSDYGDGTVPLGSARPTPELAGNGVTLAPYSGIDHVKLPNDGDVMSAALYSLEGDGPTPGTLAALDQAAPAASSGLTGTELLVSGPASVLLTDSAGRRTGLLDATTGIQAEDIPGSAYASGDDQINHVSVFLGQGSATAEIRPFAVGYVYLKERTYQNGQITSTIAYPPLLNDNQTMTFTGDITVPAGRPGVRICPICPPENPWPTVTGAGAGDELTPESTATVTYAATASGKQAHIVLNGTDTGGSGVGRLEYALEPSNADEQNLTLYTGVYGGPFNFVKPATSTSTWTLHVRAVDRAGNVESSYTKVVLDL